MECDDFVFIGDGVQYYHVSSTCPRLTGEDAPSDLVTVQVAKRQGRTICPWCRAHQGGQDSHSNPRPMQEQDVDWVSILSDPADWFSLAHEAKVNNLLRPVQRRILYSIGRRKARGWDISDKMRRAANRAAAALLHRVHIIPGH